MRGLSNIAALSLKYSAAMWLIGIVVGVAASGLMEVILSGKLHDTEQVSYVCVGSQSSKSW